MKTNYALIFYIFIASYLIGSTIFGYKMYQNYLRTSENQEILLENVKNINKDRQLVLTPSEFKHAMDSSTQAMMKDFHLKVKNLEQVVKASSHGEASIVTVPRDTFIIRNDTVLPATTFVYANKYIRLKGLQTKDSVKVDWVGNDNLTLLLYWKREGKFIPSIFGRKVYRAAIQGENPYMTYIVNENVQLKRQE